MRRVVLMLACLSVTDMRAQTGSQKVAIQRACAARVLSAQECQQKLRAGNATGAPPSQASLRADSGHWVEPHGRYTIAIAPGWHIDAGEGNLKVLKGSSWAIFDTESKQGSAADMADGNADQMGRMVLGWKVVQQQSFETPRHHASAGVTAMGDVPTRSGSELRVMTFAAQSAGSGNFVTVAASSLQADARSDQGQVMAMFNSVRFTGEQ